ncbi:MAG: GTP-binding protein [Candidatus Lokiarchaeota archaeon]|nr:GTP-binding protein [Candidatus Lokiarchaeota archaeon]
MDQQFVFKILLLGDKSVGKTTLTYKYVTGAFKRNIKQTIGVDIFSKFLNFHDTEIKFQLWDFGGHERFRQILPKYTVGANAVLLLYDITNISSFEHLPSWLDFIAENTQDIPIILIGAKKDLVERREVPFEKGEEFRKDADLKKFFEISSLTGKNVDLVFKELMEILMEKRVNIER